MKNYLLFVEFVLLIPAVFAKTSTYSEPLNQDFFRTSIVQVQDYSPSQDTLVQVGDSLELALQVSLGVSYDRLACRFFSIAGEELDDRELLPCERGEGWYFITDLITRLSPFDVLCYAVSTTDTVYGDTIRVTPYCSSVAVPKVLDASVVGVSSFVANWEEVEQADAYLLQMWQDSIGLVNLLEEDFVVYDDWQNVGTSTDNYTSHVGQAKPCRALGEGDTLFSPPVDRPVSLSFFLDASSAGDGQQGVVAYKSDQQSSFTSLHAFEVDDVGRIEVLDLSSIASHTNVVFAFCSSFNTWYLDDVLVKGHGLVKNYVFESLQLGDVLSYDIENLLPEADYYYSVKARFHDCESEWSTPIKVITLEAVTVSLCPSSSVVRLCSVSGGVEVEVSTQQKLLVYDMMGRSMYVRLIDGVEFVALNPGCYFVRLGDVVQKVFVY